MPSGIKESGLSSIPSSFFKISPSGMENQARRTWFVQSKLIRWDRAACQNENPHIFFPGKGQNDLLEQALAICNHCPIKTECLAFALCTGEDAGVWGGTSGQDRRRHRGRLLKGLIQRRGNA